MEAQSKKTVRTEQNNIQIIAPAGKRKKQNTTIGLDEQYITELSKDPVKWGQFLRAGKALFEAVNTLNRI